MKASDIDLAQLLRFEPQHGRLLLGGRRMLILSQRSFSRLAEVLGVHLGHDFAQALFAQFGYRCGVDDYHAIAETGDWDSDADRIASGPVIHMWEGLVHVEPTALTFDLAAGTLHMTGHWRNSYEAENYVQARGRSDRPVCSSLTGYASGWASTFLGRPCLATETRCEACGDPHCAFEIRPTDEWGPEAEPWRSALAATGSSMARILEQRVAERTKDLGDLRDALDHHAIVTISDHRGRIIFANERFCAVSGYTREELLGRDHRIINSGVHDTAFFAELWQTIMSGRVWRGELCNRAKDGSIFWVDSTIYPVLGADGKPVQYVALRTDISRRHDAERLVREERDRAERLASQAAQASRAKSDFLATMSHEIRTPMNGVLGFTELLLETPLDDDQRLFVETIRRSGESLLGIIDDILDFSKVEAGRMMLELRPFALREVVRDVVRLLGPKAASRGLTLHAPENDEDESLLMLGDGGRVRQVLTNLVGNSLKFTEAGGVTVRARRVDGAIHVDVTDTGIGIAPDALGRLFTPFTQADSSTTRRYGGTGLGLAISRRLVELMGGSIGADSTPGQGSTFWFRLPAPQSHVAGIAVARPSPTTTVPSDGDARPDARRRILVAEDIVVNQVLARRILESLGHDVDVVETGRQAVAYLEARCPDLIFMDCHMPDVDGFEATRLIRSREAEAVGAGGRVPIVALTASVLEAERQQCLASGMDDVVAKPFAKKTLQEAIVRWIGRPDR